MEHYVENLRHVVRPDHVSDRESSPRVGLEDHQALYLSRLLREYAAYEAPSGRRGIAWAYVEYINQCVRDEERGYIIIYAHTREARRVLCEATDGDTGEDYSEMQEKFDGLFKNPSKASDGNWE